MTFTSRARRAGQRILDREGRGPARGQDLKFTGLTQNNYGPTLTPLLKYRDFQSNCWANLRILGQPCAFYLRAGGADGGPLVWVVPDNLGFGRIVASGIEVPNNYVRGSGIKWMRRWHKATM